MAKAPRAVFPPLVLQLHHCFIQTQAIASALLMRCEHVQVCTLGRKGRTESKMQKCFFIPAETRKDLSD